MSNDKIDNNQQIEIRRCLNAKVGIIDDYSKNKNPAITLSRCEYEILFLLYLGKSEFEVSQYLTLIHSYRINPGEIAKIIRQDLYHKFNVYSIGSLIDKAVLMDSIKYIPPAFI